MSSILDTINNNNARILKMLLAVPQTINHRDLELALVHGSKLGHAECVECLLSTGLDTEVEDYSGNTPLFVSVNSNKPDIVKMLLQSNCKVNKRGRGCSTSLHVAAKLGHNECLLHLIEHGASLNIKDSSGDTPLILATKYGNYEAMKMLIGAGCNVDIQNNDGCTALHYASHKARGVNILLEAGADPDITDHDNITPILMAASEGFDEVVKALVKVNCNVNVPNNSVHKTALHILAWKGHSGCINDLILGGADLNLYDDFMHTPLWYAVENNRFEVVKLLLRANCMADTFQCASHVSPNACPARLALSKGMINVVKLFILTGYDKTHLRQGLQEVELREKIGHFDDIERWLEHAHGTMTLKQICRKWIRHHLGRSFYHDLASLPIPDVMKEYIFMKELDDDH